MARSIEAGATTLKALRDSLGVGSCCGKCVPEVRETLQRASETGCKGCGRCRHGHAHDEHDRDALFDQPVSDRAGSQRGARDLALAC